MNHRDYCNRFYAKVNHRDVLTGPTERNPLVGILLERQARWCYKHRSIEDF